MIAHQHFSDFVTFERFKILRSNRSALCLTPFSARLRSSLIVVRKFDARVKKRIEIIRWWWCRRAERGRDEVAKRRRRRSRKGEFTFPRRCRSGRIENPNESDQHDENERDDERTVPMTKTIDRAQDSRHENAARRSLARENDSSTYREEDKDQMECFLCWINRTQMTRSFLCIHDRICPSSRFPWLLHCFFERQMEFAARKTVANRANNCERERKRPCRGTVIELDKILRHKYAARCTDRSARGVFFDFSVASCPVEATTKSVFSPSITIGSYLFNG